MLTGASFGLSTDPTFTVLAEPLVEQGRATVTDYGVPLSMAPQVATSISLQAVALVAVDIEELTNADMAAAFGSAFAAFLIHRTPHADQRRLIALVAVTARHALKALRRQHRETNA